MMTDGQHVLDLADVSRSYPSGEGQVEVLKHISLKVKSGESLAIVGPSGSGKSTLLNILGTLDRPTSGRVLLDGQDVLGLDDKALSAVRNSKIGFVFQLHHLLPQCTIMENVLVPALVAGTTGAVEGRARKLLDRIGLSHRLSHRPGQLSGGECQRVAVVRALINRPRLILADEPTGSLDRASTGNLADLLIELNREEQVTLVVVTHSRDLADRMDRRLELRDGSLQDPGN
jgi:ABC-type lipoprotein export system ATPase subunit